MRLILGSKSPRRKEILSFFSLPFEQHSPPFDEDLVSFEGDPIAYAQELSRKKAVSLASLFPDALILSADTCVYKEGNIMEKPASDAEAFEMLSILNGSWHTVYTAVTALQGEKEETDCAETHVQFHQVSPEDLRHYHQAFKGTDKAGGYGIQEGGSVIVKQINGCFYNVMGLPISITWQVLRKVGINLWHYLS